MKHRILALLLALCLVCCLFAGCSKSETTAQTSEPAAAAETPAAESAPTTESAAEPAPAAAALAPSSEPAATPGTSADATVSTSASDVATAVAAVKAGDYTSAGGIHYPLTDDGSGYVTFWNPFGFGWESYMESWNEMFILPYLKEATGVEIYFDCVSQSAATEQFQLYIAGGDYSDIMQPGDYYTGGLGQAYEDEVIIDLTDLIPTDIPDYWAKLNALDENTIDSVKTDSKMLGLVVIYSNNWADGGMIARGDMAEAVGYGIADDVVDVTTIDEYTDMVKKIHDQFGTEWTIACDADDGGSIGLSANAFEGTIPSISSSATSVGMTRYGDQIIADLTTDAARKYAEWFYDMYSYGVINPEFYVTTLDQGAMMGEIGSGNMFTWTGRADGTEQFVDYLDEANKDGFSAIMPPIYAYEGQPHEYPTSVSLVDNKQFVITTSCEQVELVANYLNFGYTEGGYELYNWGVEGETFYIDDDGTYHYTDFVWNNPDGANFMMASAMSIMGQLGRYDEHGKLSDGYTEKQLVAQATWTADGEKLHDIPSRAGLTTEESNAIINQVNDVLAVASEWGLRFYTGALEINDANWADYQAALVSAGIDQVQATYQAAYESYLRGERDNIVVASTGGGAGGPPPDGMGGPPPAG